MQSNAQTVPVIISLLPRAGKQITTNNHAKSESPQMRESQAGNVEMSGNYTSYAAMHISITTKTSAGVTSKRESLAGNQITTITQAIAEQQVTRTLRPPSA